MTQPIIRSVEVEGEDIQKLIMDKIAPACDGEPMGHAILAMITFVILLMKPKISMEQLQTVVMETSQFLMLQLAGDADQLPQA